ncbi:hypothetical protein KXV35_006075, partial [Aspergillus fumigatus]
TWVSPAPQGSAPLGASLLQSSACWKTNRLIHPSGEVTTAEIDGHRLAGVIATAESVIKHHQIPTKLQKGAVCPHC